MGEKGKEPCMTRIARALASPDGRSVRRSVLLLTAVVAAGVVTVAAMPVLVIWRWISHEDRE